MRRVWIVMLLLVGCYDAPDYRGTHFRCDDQHACPGGQTCIDGTCSGAGSDGIDAPPMPEAGVACGEMTCDADHKCCADFVNGPTCLALAASCTGFAATCDGVEDCNGQPCCETGSLTIGCAATCTGSEICRDNSDCKNASRPMCCPSIATGEPWGRCNFACP